MVRGCDPDPYMKHYFKISVNHQRLYRFPYFILKNKFTFLKFKHKNNNVKTILSQIILVGGFKIKQNKRL